jgi:hypothetical protein
MIACSTQKRGLMSVEQLKSLFDIGTVVLAGLAFLFGAGALFTGNIINEREVVARRALETALSNESNRAGQLQRIALGRMLMDPKAFVKSLSGRPKARAKIVYPAGTDPEPFNFASQIERWLGSGTNSDGAGWEVELRQLRGGDAIPGLGVRPDAPLVSKAGVWMPGGFAIAASTIGMPGDFTSTASGALMKAFMDCGNGGGNIWRDPRLPENTLRLVVGPR